MYLFIAYTCVISILCMEPATEETIGAAERLLEKKMKVLVPVDESDGSFYALRWALEHLFTTNYVGQEPPQGQESNAITLVHVKKIFQPFIYPAGPVVYATPSVIDSVQKAQEAIAADILSRALNICKQNKVKVETLILEGDPKDRICEAAEQLQVDLVVVGSRGLGTIKRAFLGSVSNYCAHHLNCPVLIIKPPPKLAHDQSTSK